mgnify:CR=1 FL=1
MFFLIDSELGFLSFVCESIETAYLVPLPFFVVYLGFLCLLSVEIEYIWFVSFACTLGLYVLNLCTHSYYISFNLGFICLLINVNHKLIQCPISKINVLL